eukprot:8408238-Pyramimonas_sp.AAC.1
MKLRGSLNNRTNHVTDSTYRRQPRVVNAQGQVATGAGNNQIQGFYVIHPDEGSGKGTPRHNPRGDEPRTIQTPRERKRGAR